MPSIAGFIRELVSEDKYSSGFSDRIEERVKQMNVAQLQGLHSVLMANMKTAKTDLWRTANQTIINRIQEELKLKEKEFQKEMKLIEEFRIQQRQKVERLRAAKKEEIRVKAMIEEKAKKEATKEIMDKEYARQNEERFVIMRRIFEAEEARNKWWKRLIVIYVVLLVGCIYCLAILMQFPIYITIGGIFVVTCGVVYAGYRCHLWTLIKPIVIPQEQLDGQIELREQELIKQANSVLREKERRYQEQVKKDKLDKKKRRAEKKEKQRLEAILMEQQRLEKIAMAKEIIAREKERSSQSSKASMQSGNSVASDDQGSFALESLVEEGDGDEESIENIPMIEGKSHGNELLAPGKDDDDANVHSVPEVDDTDHEGIDTDDYDEDNVDKDGNRDEVLDQFVDELLIESRDRHSDTVIIGDEESQTSIIACDKHSDEISSIIRKKPANNKNSKSKYAIAIGENGESSQPADEKV